jgi:trans-2,3-dihydro-3-hydroxyanthranilate isomerase
MTSPVRRFDYDRVDVFTDAPFGGNPLAVFVDAVGLTDDEMQAIAREMNLSETVFCVPSAIADVGLRIFTVDRELPLAGHPTVGAIWALAARGAMPGGTGSVDVQVELGVGVVPVTIHRDPEDGLLREVEMSQRAPTFGAPFEDVDLLARALGVDRSRLLAPDLPARVVDTGIPWFLVPLADLRAIRSIRPDFELCDRVAAAVGTDLFHVFTQDTDDPASSAHTRHVWFGRVTPGEDAVTGSACGCLAAYLVGEGVILAAPTADLVLEQGAEVGRPGTVRARVEVDERGRVRDVRVGGPAVVLGDGCLILP